MEISVPYNLTADDLKIDPAAAGSDLDDELNDLRESTYRDDELARLFTSVTLLRQATGAPIADCLATAVIWERG